MEKRDTTTIETLLPPGRVYEVDYLYHGFRNLPNIINVKVLPEVDDEGCYVVDQAYNSCPMTTSHFISELSTTWSKKVINEKLVQLIREKYKL